VDGYRTYITDSALAVVLIDQTETGKLLQQQKTELQETDITQLQILV